MISSLDLIDGRGPGFPRPRGAKIFGPFFPHVYDIHRGFEAIEYSQVAKYSKKIGSKAFVFDHTATVSFT